MSHLKNKSTTNLYAAKVLHQKTLFSSVIHCAYYSCFQLMKHTWLHFMRKTENDLSHFNKGSHEFLINQTTNFLANHSKNHRNFRQNIYNLKRLRLKADYEDSAIDFQTSKKAINLSIVTQQILNKCI